MAEAHGDILVGTELQEKIGLACHYTNSQVSLILIGSELLVTNDGETTYVAEIQLNRYESANSTRRICFFYWEPGFS